MQYKTLPFQIKAFDDETGTFEGYAAVINNIDDGNDRIKPGAFTKTLQEMGNRVKICWQHDPEKPIGLPIEMHEDAHGLYVKGALNTDSFWGREAYALMKPMKATNRPVITDLSIGYDTIKYNYDSNGVRNITELKLYEFSPVTWAMNSEAQITNVKGATETTLPLADKSISWDASAAEKRVRDWAGGTDNCDFTKYAKAFFWHDPSRANEFTAYKLQFADIIDGELTAIPRGIMAAAAAIQGARGGVDIPEADVPKVKNEIATYYKKMDMTPPWENNGKGTEPKRKKALDFNTTLQQRQLEEDMYDSYWNIRGALAECIEDIIEDNTVIDKATAVANAIDQFKNAMLAWVIKFTDSGIADNEDFADEFMAAKIKMETKAGRVLSADNVSTIQATIEAMQKAINDLNVLLQNATQKNNSDGGTPNEGDDSLKKNIEDIIRELKSLRGHN